MEITYNKLMERFSPLGISGSKEVCFEHYKKKNGKCYGCSGGNRATGNICVDCVNCDLRTDIDGDDYYLA